MSTIIDLFPARGDARPPCQGFFGRFCGLMAILSAARLDAAQPAVAAAPASTGFVDVDGGKLYYEESGQGAQTVVLIHDGVIDSAVWNDVWPEFCQHFHTVRYDRRGFGKSPAATSWFAEIDDLAAVLQHLRVGHAALVGSSHGGGLPIDFTLAHPEIVQELVLVGPVLSGMPYTQHFLDRGREAFSLLQKNDVKGAIAEWSKDKYLTAPANDGKTSEQRGAQKKGGDWKTRSSTRNGGRKSTTHHLAVH
jgi:pimeloyl-ACP methyl ester carboxylesterase